MITEVIQRINFQYRIIQSIIVFLLMLLLTFLSRFIYKYHDTQSMSRKCFFLANSAFLLINLHFLGSYFNFFLRPVFPHEFITITAVFFGLLSLIQLILNIFSYFITKNQEEKSDLPHNLVVSAFIARLSLLFGAITAIPSIFYLHFEQSRRAQKAKNHSPVKKEIISNLIICYFSLIFVSFFWVLVIFT